jgi:Kef-type K+ transport system membrane component KefB
MTKNLLLYVAVLLIFGAGIYFIMQAGSQPRPSESVNGQKSEAITQPSSSSQPDGIHPRSNSAFSFLRDNLQGPLSLLLLQIIVIIIAARMVGNLFLKIGQPAVVGEMIAGILLGPSVLGLIAPGTLEFLFPASSMGSLKLLSQIGVIIFMFVVGMEMNAQYLREKAEAAVLISHASIIVPFFLGVALSLFIYPSVSSSGISFNAFALFMGIAMSITAFPVLARIIEERKMSKSYLGSIAIACAAVDDATAWCLLAVVVALVRAGTLGTSILTIVLALIFTGTMIFLLKPWFDRLIKKNGETKIRSRGFVTVLLAFVFASAWLTEIIGIHALFGAFLAGTVMPSSSEVREYLRERLETFSTASLLPLFFAFTGLRTQINLLNDVNSWLLCAGVIAVAISGKLGGSMLAARWTGMNWRDSFSIGALMNTRGLVELIVLNIGYDLGVLPARIFAVMVLMALVTTAMTGPLLSLVRFSEQKKPVLTPSMGSAT